MMQYQTVQDIAIQVFQRIQGYLTDPYYEIREVGNLICVYLKDTNWPLEKMPKDDYELLLKSA